MEEEAATRFVWALLCLCSALAVGSALPQPSSWTPCDASGEYKVVVKDVDVVPDPVIAGAPATFSIPASTSHTITGGKVMITVFYRGFPVHTELDDLCSKTTCPVEPGDFTIKDSQILPGYTPPNGLAISKIGNLPASVFFGIYSSFME